MPQGSLSQRPGPQVDDCQYLCINVNFFQSIDCYLFLQQQIRLASSRLTDWRFNFNYCININLIAFYFYHVLLKLTSLK